MSPSLCEMYNVAHPGEGCKSLVLLLDLVLFLLALVCEMLLVEIEMKSLVELRYDLVGCLLFYKHL